jgi:hypothetical protein
MFYSITTGKDRDEDAKSLSSGRGEMPNAAQRLALFERAHREVRETMRRLRLESVLKAFTEVKFPTYTPPKRKVKGAALATAGGTAKSTAVVSVDEWDDDDTLDVDLGGNLVVPVSGDESAAGDGGVSAGSVAPVASSSDTVAAESATPVPAHSVCSEDDDYDGADVDIASRVPTLACAELNVDSDEDEFVEQLSVLHDVAQAVSTDPESQDAAAAAAASTSDTSVLSQPLLSAVRSAAEGCEPTADEQVMAFWADVKKRQAARKAARARTPVPTLAVSVGGQLMRMPLSAAIAMLRINRTLSADRMLRICQAVKQRATCCVDLSTTDAWLVPSVYILVRFERKLELGRVVSLGTRKARGKSVVYSREPVSLTEQPAGMLVFCMWLEEVDVAVPSTTVSPQARSRDDASVVVDVSGLPVFRYHDKLYSEPGKAKCVLVVGVVFHSLCFHVFVAFLSVPIDSVMGIVDVTPLCIPSHPTLGNDKLFSVDHDQWTKYSAKYDELRGHRVPSGAPIRHRGRSKKPKELAQPLAVPNGVVAELLTVAEPSRATVPRAPGKRKATQFK